MKRRTLAIPLALVCAFGINSSLAEPISLAYEFEASNFSDGFFDGTPPPVESVSGSIGFTFEPSGGAPIVYDVVPDFVDFTILGFEYTTENTLVTINDGDSIAIVIGGAPAANFTSAFTNDFSFAFFISQSGEVLPNLIGGFVVRIESSFDGWIAVSPDVTVNLRSLDPISLVDQLIEVVAGVGPGRSFTDKLVQVKAYIEAGDDQAACEMLNAFANQVNAQTGKKVTVEAAEQSLAQVNAIQETIGCE